MSLLFLLVIRRPTRSKLFPYTTLFRSRRGHEDVEGRALPVHDRPARRQRRREEVTVGTDWRLSVRTGGCRYGLTLVGTDRSEEHTSELQSQSNLVCRLLLEKKN